MSDDTGPGSTILDRLRKGPLASRDANEVASGADSLKVLICRLRKRGYLIESEPDPERRNRDGSQNLRAVRYVLRSEPET